MSAASGRMCVNSIQRTRAGLFVRVGSSPISDSMATSSVLYAPGPEVVVVDTTPNRENKMDDDANEVEPITPPASKKRGRKVPNAWQYFSERDDSHLHSNVKCKHCKRDVSTTMKSERAVSHLPSCYQFKRAMADVDDGERPPWFNRKATGSKPTPSSTMRTKSNLLLHPLRRSAVAKCQTRGSIFQNAMILTFIRM